MRFVIIKTIILWNVMQFDWQNDSIVSKESAASIFQAEKNLQRQTSE
jgi:hypothetical protein